MPKPSVLVHALSGSERSDWINPQLAGCLIQMSKDQRFNVTTTVSCARPIDYARNCCVAHARAVNADWLLMVDNDQEFYVNPLDVLAAASPEMDIVGLSSAMSNSFAGGEFRLATRNIVGGLLTMPDLMQGSEFIEVSDVGTGCMAIRSTVWQRLKGPWFRYEPRDDELLTMKCPEDYYFCKRARAEGFKVWTHRIPIGHLKTVDITRLLFGCTTDGARMQSGAVDMSAVELTTT